MKKCIIFIIIFFFNGLHSVVSKPLTILFVTGHFPAPSQTFILNIMTGLIDRGHSIWILSYNRDNIHQANSIITQYRLLDRVIYGDTPKIDIPYDIVFCQFGYTGKKLYRTKHLAWWLAGQKVVTCIRGSDITARVKQERTIYKRLFQKGDLFLPVCNYFVAKMRKLGCDKNKIVVHHSAIDCSKFFFKKRIKPYNNALNIVSVCRLVEKKGLDDAIIACSYVIKKYPNIHYTIFGEGPERNKLERLIRSLHMEKYVTLAGWASQEKVVEALNNAHIFVLASKTSSDGNEEGIPNALKEAMATGVPVIATYHAGNAELIQNGVSGFLVPENNAGEIAKKMQYLIEHPEQWENICLAARKKVEDEFEIKKTVAQLEQLFYKLLEK